jgi:drug/metabolite transporter (DMT)-like permease
MYAACFSFAYLGLTAGTGALILFGSVQVTMIATAWVKGERPRIIEWVGLLLALFGLWVLVFPNLSTPPTSSALLMITAGICWGVYSLRGRSSSDPISETTGNFVRSLPFVVVIALIYLKNLQFTPQGWLLAIISGAVTSRIGYSFWYAALRHLSSTRAAVLQLVVPVITAVVGILLLSEAATAELAIASALILGGIGITILGRQKKRSD